jgi:hypothetical protein
LLFIFVFAATPFFNIFFNIFGSCGNDTPSSLFSSTSNEEEEEDGAMVIVSVEALGRADALSDIATTNL